MELIYELVNTFKNYDETHFIELFNKLEDDSSKYYIIIRINNILFEYDGIESYNNNYDILEIRIKSKRYNPKYYDFIDKIFNNYEFNEMDKYKFSLFLTYYWGCKSILKKLLFTNYFHKFLYQIKTFDSDKINFLLHFGNGVTMGICLNIDIIDMLKDKCEHNDYIKLIKFIFDRMPSDYSFQTTFQTIRSNSKLNLFTFIKTNYGTYFKFSDFDKNDCRNILLTLLVCSYISVEITDHGEYVQFPMTCTNHKFVSAINFDEFIDFIEMIINNNILNEHDIKLMNELRACKNYPIKK